MRTAGSDAPVLRVGNFQSATTRDYPSAGNRGSHQEFAAIDRGDRYRPRKVQSYGEMIKRTMADAADFSSPVKPLSF